MERKWFRRFVSTVPWVQWAVAGGLGGLLVVAGAAVMIIVDAFNWWLFALLVVSIASLLIAIGAFLILELRALRIVVPSGDGTARIRDGAAEQEALDEAGLPQRINESTRLQLDAHFYVTNVSERAITIVDADLKRRPTTFRHVKTTRHSSDPESADAMSLYTGMIDPGLTTNVHVTFQVEATTLPERPEVGRVVLTDQFGHRHVTPRVRFHPKESTVFDIFR